MSSYSYLVGVLLVLAAGAFASVRLGKLSPGAGAWAFVVGIAFYAGCGLTGLAELAAFFAMATIATAHQKEKKALLIGERKHQERRRAGQVLANGGVAALLGLLAWQLPQQQLLLAAMAAGAIASATADTLASELGTIYGRRAFNILNLRPGIRGQDGVVSLEGTLLGLAGSAIIALIHVAGHGWHAGFWLIVLAGTVGNLADSLLGAALERKGYLNNDQVNALNTLIAALTVLLAGRQAF